MGKLKRTGNLNRKAGLTLIEVAIALGLMVIVMSGVALLSSAGADSYSSAAVSSNIDSRSSEVAERLLQELEGVSPTGVMIPAPGLGGTDTLLFQTPWGKLTRIDYQMDTSEVNDGIDNDGDGLIDEGGVVLTRDVGGAGEISTVICNGVSEYLEGEISNLADDNGNDMDDESGFCLQTIGDLLIVRLTLLDSDGNGHTTSRTVETSIRMRN